MASAWRSPLANGSATGMPIAPAAAVQDVISCRTRAVQPPKRRQPAQAGGDCPHAGAHSRRAGAGSTGRCARPASRRSPRNISQRWRPRSTSADIGARADGFDLVLGANRELLYAGLERVGQGKLQLVRWNANGRSEWIDPAAASRPQPIESGMAMPANGPITSYFGNRYHPILHFTRFHAGVDIGAAWGSPIVAAADGQVASAGWSGGYGREVQIAHGGGLVSLYGHIRVQIVAQPGGYVRQGQLIGYVGSSGLSTGPHLHFEVRQSGQPVNPLGVRLVSRPVVDTISPTR